MPRPAHFQILEELGLASGPELGGWCRMRLVLTSSHLGDPVIKKLIIVLALVAIGGLVAKKVTSS